MIHSHTAVSYTHLDVYKRQVVFHAGKVQAQQIRRLGKSHLLLSSQAHLLLCVTLKIAIPGQKRNFPALAEITAVFHQRQDIGGAPGHHETFSRPLAKPADRLHEGNPVGQVFIRNTGKVGNGGADTLSHLGFHKTGKALLFLKIGAALHGAEFNNFIDIALSLIHI